MHDTPRKPGKYGHSDESKRDRIMSKGGIDPFVNWSMGIHCKSTG